MEHEVETFGEIRDNALGQQLRYEIHVSSNLSVRVHA